MGGRRYYFSNILVNAAEGLSLCQEINMTLAGFETVQEYITIINHIENTHGWGANGFYFTSGVRHTNIWIWSNVGLPMTYFVWNSGPDIEPDFTTDLTTQQCLVLSPNGMWDGYCNHVANFVCEQLGV
ncbi:hypothetical protein B566_EDAN011130 [Ephemera danica]|nr:hypothetical protein B566_EDAN011130 [Ephemera danica]